MFFSLIHRYGRDGRDSKKFEDKSLVFNFFFLQRIAEKHLYKIINCPSTHLSSCSMKNQKQITSPHTYPPLSCPSVDENMFFNHVSFIFLKTSHINPAFLTLNPTKCAP
jgi:hypothetical protein